MDYKPDIYIFHIKVDLYHIFNKQHSLDKK